MKINVTKKHVDNGKPCACSSCPIALAMQDMGFVVSVGTPTVTLQKVAYSRTNHVVMPREALMFIAGFDMGDKVEPFSFSLSAENFMF